MRYYFAPMEGVTGAVYRRTHHDYFPGIDKYFMPFITPTANGRLTPRQKRDVAPEVNAGVPAVPQLLTKSAEDFIWAANALFDMGYPSCFYCLQRWRQSPGKSSPWAIKRRE